jgi:hypothetical protein
MLPSIAGGCGRTSLKDIFGFQTPSLRDLAVWFLIPMEYCETLTAGVDIYQPPK